MEKIWKTVEKINFSECEELLKEFKKNNFKVSRWIDDIVKKNKKTLIPNQYKRCF